MTDRITDPADILARYLAGPAQLRAALAGLTDSQLDLAQATETWTIRQITHHIVDGDDLWKMAVKAALGNGDTNFDLIWYWEKPQDEWAQCWNYAGRALEPSLVLFEANRHHVQQLVERIPHAWDCSIGIRWPRKEPERATVGDILAMQARHTTGHIAEIQAIRLAHGLPWGGGAGA